MPKIDLEVSCYDDPIELYTQKKTEPKPVEYFTEGLNEDQLKAFHGIINSNSKHIILEGAAGTGKTFTLAKILNYFDSQLYTIAAVAPTHKACHVMERTGLKAGLNVEYCTLAAALRLKPGRNDHGAKVSQENHGSQRKQLHEFDVAWIDESSMIKESEYTRISTRPCKHLTIFTGDSFQLPPFGEDVSPVFERVEESFTLTKIERYQGSIGAYVTSIREQPYAANLPALSTEFDTEDKSSGILKYTSSQSWLRVMAKAFKSDEYKINPDYCKIIAYRNDRATKLNQFIRSELYPNAEVRFIQGDKLITKSPVFNDEGDLIIQTQKELQILEASIGTSRMDNLIIKHWVLDVITDEGVVKTLTPVHEDSEEELSNWLSITRGLIKSGESKWNWRNFDEVLHKYLLDDKENKDRKGNVLGISYQSVLQYAFAITVMSSQGSTYNNIFVDLGDINVLLKVGTDSVDAKRLKRNKAAYTALTRASNRVMALV